MPRHKSYRSEVSTIWVAIEASPSIGSRTAYFFVFQNYSTRLKMDHQIDCSICLDTIENTRYGWLINCTHLFCYGCIAKYRSVSKDLRCPLCRIKSMILIPSRVYPTYEEKERLINVLLKKLEILEIILVFIVLFVL